jgi:hypothetical protein
MSRTATSSPQTLLCPYGKDCDFVCARFRDREGRARNIVGGADGHRDGERDPRTLAFTAPEQDWATRMLTTARNSTACMAYWLLRGQLAFTAAMSMKLLLAHAPTPPDPSSSRTDIPIAPELDALVLSCPAKDREHRPELQRLDAVACHQRWTEARARERKVHLPQ